MKNDKKCRVHFIESATESKDAVALEENPILHRMFSLLGFGERAGSGLSLIDTIWKENRWISPSIEEGHNPDRTTLVLITQEENDYTKNYPNNYSKNYTDILN